MTAHNYPTIASATPWQRYLDREHAARDMYLEVTSRASHEYLTGPRPDRAAYEVVERQAWATYYAAGRDAWRTYVREATPPPPPPPADPGIVAPESSNRLIYPAQPYDRDAPKFYPATGGNE